MRPSLTSLIVLLVVIILIFGAPKLPMIARNIGKSLKVFKSEVDDLSSSSADEEGGAHDRPARPITDSSSAPSVDEVTRSAEQKPEAQAADDDVRRDG